MVLFVFLLMVVLFQFLIALEVLELTQVLQRSKLVLYFFPKALHPTMIASLFVMLAFILATQLLIMRSIFIKSLISTKFQHLSIFLVLVFLMSSSFTFLLNPASISITATPALEWTVA